MTEYVSVQLDTTVQVDNPHGIPYTRVTVYGLGRRSVLLADGAAPWHASRDLRTLAAELLAQADRLDGHYPTPSEAARRDAAMIEAIDDDRRILLALTTEARRLRRHGAEPGDARLDHTERLIRVFSDRVAEYPATERLCPCVVLPSGKVYPCKSHVDELTESGLAVDAAYRRPRPRAEADAFKPIALWIPDLLGETVMRVVWDATGTYTLEFVEPEAPKGDQPA